MNLKGCYVATVTPFNEKNAIDEKGLRSNINYLIENGVDGIVPCGSTGESATLSWKEHERVVEITIDEVRGLVPVIAGAGSNSTREAINAAKHSEKSGADAILCITPYYNKPTQEGLFQHFRAIAQSVKLPIVVYNVPSRTGVNLLPETLQRLGEFENIVAVKEASGDVLQISEIHKRLGDRMVILSGDDALTLPVLAVGGKGVISVTGNILPAKTSAMIRAFFDGRMDDALSIHEELLPVTKALFIETNPIPVKTAMNWLGLSAGTLRLPLVPMSESNKQLLLSVLKASNIKPLNPNV